MKITIVKRLTEKVVPLRLFNYIYWRSGLMQELDA